MSVTVTTFDFASICDDTKNTWLLKYIRLSMPVLLLSFCCGQFEFALHRHSHKTLNGEHITGALPFSSSDFA